MKKLNTYLLALMGVFALTWRHVQTRSIMMRLRALVERAYISPHQSRLLLLWMVLQVVLPLMYNAQNLLELLMPS